MGKNRNSSKDSEQMDEIQPSAEVPESLGVDSRSDQAAESSEDDDRKILEAVQHFANSRRGTTKLYQIDWKQVANHLGDKYEADSVHKRFVDLISKVRKVRTAQEIVADALNTLGQPSRPPGAYLLFSKKMRKKHGDIPSKDFFKLVSDDWKNLKESKKKRYFERAVKMREEYKMQLAEWRENHGLAPNPEAEKKKGKRKNQELASSTSAGIENGPAKKRKRKIRVKPVTAYDLFIEGKKDIILKKHPEITPFNLKAKLLRKWNRLRTDKKEKYLEQALTRNRSASQVSSSGYLVFCRETRQELMKTHPGESSRDITKMLGAMWQALGEEEKNAYKSRAKNVTSDVNGYVSLIVDKVPKEEPVTTDEDKLNKEEIKT